MNDEIMQELRQIKESIAKRFDYDIARIAAYHRQEEAKRLAKARHDEESPNPEPCLAKDDGAPYRNAD